MKEISLIKEPPSLEYSAVKEISDSKMPYGILPRRMKGMVENYKKDGSLRNY